MSKKYTIGDNVIVTFICADYNCTITDIYNEERNTFWAIATDGTKIPNVGIDGSEKWANIFTEKQK